MSDVLPSRPASSSSPRASTLTHNPTPQTPNPTPQKQGKAWPEAAEAYRQLATCTLKTDAKHDAAAAYVEGAKCLLKQGAAPGAGNAASSQQQQQHQDGVAMLREAVALYTDMGRLNMAARQLREIAEAQEKAGAKSEAVAFYEQAADLFATENATSDANRCRLKVAELLSSELEDYAKASQLFEEVGKAAADNNLLKYSAKGHFLCAGICAMLFLSDDDVASRIERYKDSDLQFAGSREAQLLEGCAAALAGSDDKAFSQAVAEFDAMTRLDGWKTAMLLRVKRRIAARQQGEEKGAGGGGDDDEEVL